MSTNVSAIVLYFLCYNIQRLMSNCYRYFTRYIQCIHQKLYHLTAADYEDFANIILAARTAFQITPEGNAQFKDWLQSIRR